MRSPILGIAAFMAIAALAGCGSSDKGTSGDIGAACADAGTPLPCDLCAVSDREEIDIMSIALDAVLEPVLGTDHSIAVRSVTRFYESNASFIFNDATEVDAATLEDFKDKNYGGKQYCVEGALTSKTNYRFVDDATYEQMRKDVATMDFDGSHPDAVAELGRVGFNADRTEAIAFAQYIGGSLSSRSMLYLVRKTGSTWAIYKSLGGWGS